MGDGGEGSGGGGDGVGGGGEGGGAIDANVPTQSASRGANTMRPLNARAAPKNFFPLLMVALMSIQLNTLVAASKVPIQSASSGARTIRPLGAATTPVNL